MQSLYFTRIGYQFSSPLTVTFLLGMQNNQYGGNLRQQSLTIPVGGVQLDWRPREDMYFRMSIMRAPSGMYGYGTSPFMPYNNSYQATLEQGDNPFVK